MRVFEVIVLLCIVYPNIEGARKVNPTRWSADVCFRGWSTPERRTSAPTVQPTFRLMIDAATAWSRLRVVEYFAEIQVLEGNRRCVVEIDVEKAVLGFLLVRTNE